MLEVRKTICNRYCPDACGIVASVADGKVVQIRGDKDHPITRGFLCYRTSLFLGTQYSPERLQTPLLKIGGKFQPVSWDEALDVAAERLVRIRQESGPAAIFHYRSGGSLGLLKHLTDYFFEQFGPVTVKRGDICSGAGDAAQELDFGEEDSHDVFDLLNSRNILLWGKNVFTSSPHLVPILREARAKGSRLVLIDPVYHKTATLCERLIQLRPGGDFALCMAVARLLLERGWMDPDAANCCDHYQDFLGLAKKNSVSEWCRKADVDPDAASDLAVRLGRDKPSDILVGWGMERRINGAGIVRALDALCVLSGNLGIPGGGVSFYFKRRGAFDLSFLGGEAVAPRTVCEPIFGPDVLKMSNPPIRAVWVTAGNPVAMLPESETTARALGTREFVVVADSFMTDTAQLAHLVLPTTTLLEADDLLGSYGHHWIGAATPVVTPPPEVKSDLQIIQALAERVGLGERMAGTAREWKRRLIGPKLRSHGITLEHLEAGALRNPIPPEVLFADRKFTTPTGRVNLIDEAPPEREVVAEYPLCLMALSTEKSQSSQWAAPQAGALAATVHPDAANGIPHGEMCRLESRTGWMRVVLHHDARQRKDVVLLPKGGHLRDGRCANVLLKARITDLGEGGALYDEPVRLMSINGGKDT